VTGRIVRGGLQFRFGVGERWALAGALSFAAVDVMLRAAAPRIDSWFGSLLTLIPLAVVSWLLLARSGFREIRPHHDLYLGGRLIGGLVIGGLVGYVVGNVLFFRALADGGLAISVNALQGGNVWGGVILGLLLLRERPGLQRLVGGVVIVIGLAIIAVSRLDTPGHAWFLGLLLAVAAGLCYATTNVFARLVQRDRAAVVAVLGCTAAGGLVPLVLIVAVRLVADPAGILTGLQARDALVVLASGVLSIVAMVCVAKAVRHTAVATVNAIGASTVVYTLLASMILFAESASLLTFVGVAAVLGGILVGQSTRRAAANSEPGPAPVPVAAAEAAGGVDIQA
jgi:drug/metabolite transporter (DMT)-like permease